MKPVAQTLHGRLAFSLLGLLALLAVMLVSIFYYATPLFLQELNQRLNAPLAANLVKEKIVMRHEEIDNQALQSIFMTLMVVNPAIEVYLVDNFGRILAFSAPPGHVKREMVDLEPLQRFISQRENFPILGDDPRHETRKKVFSVAPIVYDDRAEGYLYVILGGETFESVLDVIKSSYSLQLGFVAVFLMLVSTAFAGLFLFNTHTRRLRSLTQAMNEFKRDNYATPLEYRCDDAGPPRDEIDQLCHTFLQMAKRIHSQLRELQQTDETRRELIANVSHDLRTPLANLHGYLETLLLRDRSLTDAEREEYIHTALRHSHRLRRLISELFELATLENRQQLMQVEPFSLAELAHDVVQKFRLEAGKKKIELAIHVQNDSPCVVADIALIERVLENLVDNAIKYTPAGGTICLSINAEKNDVVTTITDTGCGIPDTDIPHIFERFYRVEKHRQTPIEGTGLGLAITRRILELHNRVIRVASEPGSGSTFSFELPVWSPASV